MAEMSGDRHGPECPETFVTTPSRCERRTGRRWYAGCKLSRLKMEEYSQ
jgi:hypothetical protein